MARYIRDFMTPKEECAIVGLDDTIADLKQELCKKRHRMAIVVRGKGKAEDVVGVVTVSDLEFVDDDDLVEEDHYNSPAYTILADKPISAARKELNRASQEAGRRVHQLVVVNERNQPLGILWDYVAILGCPDATEKKS